MMVWFSNKVLIILLVIKMTASASISSLSGRMADKCPEYATLLYDGRCQCDTGTISFIFPENGRLHCEKCLQCPYCQGSAYECNNMKPYPYEGKVNCTSPEDGYHLKGDTFEECQHSCRDIYINEIETQHCHCYKNRKCGCAHGYYRNGQGVCLNKCSKCPVSVSIHDEVPVGYCMSMPVNFRCKQLDHPETTKSLITNTTIPPTPKASTSLLTTKGISTTQSPTVTNTTQSSTTTDTTQATTTINTTQITTMQNTTNALVTNATNEPTEIDPTNEPTEIISTHKNEHKTRDVAIAVSITIFIVALLFLIVVGCKKCIKNRQEASIYFRNPKPVTISEVYESTTLLNLRGRTLQDLLSGLSQAILVTKVQECKETWKHAIHVFFIDGNSQIDRRLLKQFVEKVYMQLGNIYALRRIFFDKHSPEKIFEIIAADVPGYTIKQLFQDLHSDEVKADWDSIIVLKKHMLNTNNN